MFIRIGNGFYLSLRTGDTSDSKRSCVNFLGLIGLELPMKSRHRALLAKGLLIFGLTSTLSGEILVTQDFESEEDLNNKTTRFYREITTPESISLVSHPVRSGKSALKIDFCYPDWKKEEPKRVEIFNMAGFGPDGMTLRKNWWVGFSQYISSDWLPDHPNNPDIIWQFHGYEGGPASGNPPLSAVVFGDKLYIRLAQGTTPAVRAASFLDLAVMPLPKGVWMDIVLQLKFDYKEGHVGMWLNGKKTVDYNGPTLYPMIGQVNEKGPGFKAGVYKFDWGNLPTQVQRRTLFLDEIRYGDSTSSYEEVKPR